MRKRALHLLLLLTVGLSAAALPSLALADNSPSSAGDQQYVDPLGNNGGGHHHSSGTTTTPSSTPAPASSTPTATTAATSTTPTASTASTTSSKTLPYTGFETGLGLAIGCCLLGGGFFLRRRLRL